MTTCTDHVRQDEKPLIPPAIAVERPDQELRRRARRRQPVAGVPPRRDSRGAGRERRRQEHADEDALRLLPSRRRRDHARRRQGDVSFAGRRAQARHRHGVPELHPDPGDDGAGKHRPADPDVGISIDRAGLTSKILELSARYGLDVDPSKYVRDLSIGEQQRAEILKMLASDASILILDEPTSVLDAARGRRAARRAAQAAGRRLRADHHHAQAARGVRLRRPGQRPATAAPWSAAAPIADFDQSTLLHVDGGRPRRRAGRARGDGRVSSRTRRASASARQTLQADDGASAAARHRPGRVRAARSSASPRCRATARRASATSCWAPGA